MQTYYNIIPSFGVGGLIEKIAKQAGRAKIQRYANLLSKERPELSNLLSKLAKSQEKGPKLSEKEAGRLVTLSQNYRRNQGRKKLNEQIVAERKSTPKPTEAPTEQPAQPANPVPGKTLSDRWQQLKTWVNNHPKTAVGVPLLMVGTGPGRYITDNVIKATQSNPVTWFGNAQPEATQAQDFIVINGTKIPIKKSSEGYFVPVEENTQPTMSTDDLDSIIAEVNNAEQNLAPVIPSQPGDPGYSDNSAINDLFEDDQWQ